METIINFSTYDSRFIKKVIEEAEKFSNKVIVIYYDYFFDGVLENKDKINDVLGFGNKTEYLELKWDKNKSAKYHHNFARWEGLKKCNEDYVMFLNSDEIVEGGAMADYLKTNHYKNYDGIGFDCYWYFREPEFRAKQHEEIGFIVKSSICSEDFIFSVNETSNYKYTNGLKVITNFKPNGNTIVHHYSWVRDKEDMMRKVSSWAHSKDRDWRRLVEKEFTHEFDGTDFVHGYDYELVENEFDV